MKRDVSFNGAEEEKKGIFVLELHWMLPLFLYSWKSGSFSMFSFCKIKTKKCLIQLAVPCFLSFILTYDGEAVVPLPAKRQVQPLVEILLHLLREDGLVIGNVLQVIGERQIPELEWLLDDQFVEYVLSLTILAHDAVLFGVLQRHYGPHVGLGGHLVARAVFERLGGGGGLRFTFGP